MAYAHKVTRVTISGTCFSGAEIWSTGFFVGGETTDAVNPTLAGANAIRAAWATFFGTAANAFCSKWTTTQVKLALLNTSGTTDPDHVVYADYPTPTVGGGTSTAFPSQITLVATMASSLARGLAAKGRMYLPGINTAVDTSGHVTTGYPATLAGNLKTFMDTVNASSDVGGRVILASEGRTAPAVGPPVNKFVTTLKIGNTYDTQRRRRNDLVETYVTSTLA